MYNTFHKRHRALATERGQLFIHVKPEYLNELYLTNVSFLASLQCDSSQQAAQESGAE